jgi:hypothetical protein
MAESSYTSINDGVKDPRADPPKNKRETQISIHMGRPSSSEKMFQQESTGNTRVQGSSNCSMKNNIYKFPWKKRM